MACFSDQLLHHTTLLNEGCVLRRSKFGMADFRNGSNPETHCLGSYVSSRQLRTLSVELPVGPGAKVGPGADQLGPVTLQDSP